MERKHNRGIGMSHKPILSRIRGPIQDQILAELKKITDLLTPKPPPPPPPKPKGLIKEFRAFLSTYKVLGMAVAFTNVGNSPDLTAISTMFSMITHYWSIYPLLSRKFLKNVVSRIMCKIKDTFP